MNLYELQDEIRRCRYCKDTGLLPEEPNPLVWGEKEAKIVQISQAPSKSASKCGRPFSKDKNIPDGSGKRLIKWYQIPSEIFYDPKIFYITGLGHCYPGRATGGDKAPPYECARRWLNSELSYLDPDMFIVIGKRSASFLFPEKEYYELIFNDQKLFNKLAVVLPHPSTANNRWLSQHKEFEYERLPVIRKYINSIVYA